MMDPKWWPNPRLIDCGCGRCQRGGQCQRMRELHAESAARTEYLGQVSALTDEDLTWLLAAGWEPPI
jgi:hypothetical protein